ncbi:hypothetical protein D3H65_23195 [Paraflavitalea soli]|uniref:Uncharacterized protein n=1 Tax=Paraflavitalea soli TaxID=2315862 RepID=A0A3B7N3A8_9BACT|nr:hypothetical protein [Paraflavitalea soli]AXY76721.1 hypothetical protein D3H65_23195 [Paraflavitalea soli]
MLVIVRIITIIVSAAWLVAGGWLIAAGILDEPETDFGAIWIGIGIVAFYLANIYLVYRGYKKKHKPVQWVAFILSILPAVVLGGIILILNWIDP